MQELERLDVDVRLSSFAEPDDVLAERPDAVIVATGGSPDLDWLDGAEHCTSTWDVLTGSVPLGSEVVVYDGTGRHPAPQVLELAVAQGRQVSLVSIDAQLAQELTYAERAIWKRRIYELGVSTTFDHELEKIDRRGNRITATFRNMMTGAAMERSADQVVVEHGTLPSAPPYDALRARSSNDGVTDIDALLALRAQPRRADAFELHRIGDAVASRNIHAAVLDAVRIGRAL